MEYLINFIWDDEADVWIALNEKIGLALESKSYDKLVKRVELAVPELLELNKLPKSTSLRIKSEKQIMNV